MQKKVIIWYCAFVLLVLSVVPFINLMLNKTVTNVIIVIAWLAVSSPLYAWATKHITLEKGYTAIDAIDFYKSCRKENISVSSLRKDQKSIRKIATEKEYAKDLELSELYELFHIGYNLIDQKG